MDIFSQFHHDPPRYKEKALTTLKIPEINTTPRKILKMVWSPLKMVSMVSTTLERGTLPREDVFDTSPK